VSSLLLPSLAALQRLSLLLPSLAALAALLRLAFPLLRPLGQ
tara:strand:- start:135 stop:260 length:126 start_codon:yes stop_codon:yes gene_type:complete